LVPILKLIFVFFNEIVQKCVEYCKKHCQKKLEFFKKTQIKYEFLTLENIKIHIKLMFSSKNLIFFWRDSYSIMNVSANFYLKI